MESKQILLEGEEVRRTISRMAHEIVERNGGVEDLALIGIRSRGAHLVRRIAQKIETLNGAAPPVGIIDVRSFRDDLEEKAGSGERPPMDVAISVDEKAVVLIDDVIYTGRTVRAGLDFLNHLGKPKKIILAILIDRGDREVPIKADVVGKNVKVKETERVNVLLQESDGLDQVTVTPRQR